MKIESVKYSAVKNSVWRFDPSFHLSEAVYVHQLLEKSPYKMSKVDCCSDRVFLGNIFSRNFVKDKEHGVPYLAASDTVLADINTGAFLSKRQANELSYLMLEKDWILVTCSGTVGNVTYTNKCFENHIATHDLIRIVPNDKIVKRGCLYAYLSSKFGHCLLTQSEFGGVVKHINDEYVRNVPIPQFPTKFQEKVDNLIKESARLREEANRFLNEAVSEFEKCLNPECYKRKFCTSTVSTKQILKKFNRLDSHYQIAQKEFVKRRKKGLKYEKIGPKAERIFVGNRGKRLYSKEGVPFLSSSDMMLFNALRYSKNISVNTPSLKMMQVHKNEILISRSGTVGNSVLISDLLNKKAVSEHALRLLLDEQKIKPSYVFAYLNTEEGRELLQSLAYGSVIVTLGEDFVADIDLPILDEQIQRKIIQKINEYVWASDSAAEKESLAISLVEKEIDGWKA